MRIHELREKRGVLINEMRGLVAAAETESRDLSDNERGRFDAIKGEIAGLDSRIQRAAFLAEAERQADAEPITGQRGAPDLRSYSIARAINAHANGKTLDGVEGEMHAELSRGRDEVRGIIVPTQILLGETRTGQIVGDSTKGGYLVETQVAPVQDRFRAMLATERMGATVLRNLTGDLDLPNLAESGSASWGGENAEATRSDVEFSKNTLTPKTVLAEYKMSRRLMKQASQSVEQILRSDLGYLLAQSLDSAALNGAGTPTVPGGILQAGIEKVTTETLFSDTTANLIAALDLDNVTGTRSFITNPYVMKVARKYKDGEDRPIPLSVAFHNERVETTTQVPSNIGVGANKSALIYGQWDQLVIGYWGAIDIVPNIYHPDVASSGGMLLHAFLDCDVAIRDAVAFAYAEIA